MQKLCKNHFWGDLNRSIITPKELGAKQISVPVDFSFVWDSSCLFIVHVLGLCFLSIKWV